jgi:replicative DNA helicase
MMERVVHLLSPADFYKPANGLLWHSMVQMWNKGIVMDPVTVADKLTEDGVIDRVGGPATLISLISHTPAVSSAPRYAEIIVKMATYRRALRVAHDLVEDSYEMTADPNDLIEEAMGALSTIGVRIGDVPGDAFVLDDYLNRPVSERQGWIIPGLIRGGWRVMVVAGEGVGKTVLFRQIAIMAAQGLHPLHSGEITPARTLIVDLENPEDSVMDVCIPINDKVKSRVTGKYEADRAWLWHRPAGINLRSRTDRIAFESVISHVRPELVCMGPLYKAYEVNAHENDELAAREVMRVFDDLRTRYGFGLMLEHHAPKESAGTKRKLMPYGSSLWLRWPEIGINLAPEKDGPDVLTLGRWRGDRLENEWPESISRSGSWPWTGIWPTGYFNSKGGTDGVHRREAIPEPVAPPDDYEEPF